MEKECFTYSECVSIALVIQHAMHMHQILIDLCPVWLYHIFSQLINGIFFWKVIEHKMCGKLWVVLPCILV